MRAALAVLCAVAAVAQAHICIISPQQRGAFNITTPGDPSCYRRTDYCGGVAVGSPLTAYTAGAKVTVALEQNLNHFYPPKPGYFDIAITSVVNNPTDGDFTTLTTWPDAPAFDMVQQTVLHVPITLPSQPSAHSILRVRYVSYNQDEVDPATNTDAIFYNCADIAIVAAPSTEVKLVKSVKPTLEHVGHSWTAAKLESVSRDVAAAAAAAAAASSAAPSTYNCTTPAQWTANFTESNAWGFVSHTIWWDAKSQYTRWDRSGWLSAAGPSTLSLINDYTKPIEYVNFVDENVCEQYGNDAWYPWAYGGALNMAYVGRASSGVDMWTMQGGNSYSTFVSVDMGLGLCAPLTWTRGEASVSVVNIQVGGIDPAVFKPAPSCTQSPTFAGCHADALRARYSNAGAGLATTA